jgi:exopolysaccharide production protein ExoQ
MIINRRKFFLNIEKILTVLILLIYHGAIIELVLSGGRQEAEIVESVGTPLRITYALTYLVIFSLLILRWKRTLYFITRNWLIWILILLPIVSLIWSFERDVTLKNSFTLLCSSLFGVYLISRYSLKEQLQLFSWSFYIIIGLSFVFAIGLPKYGLMGEFHQGKWRGVFTHKNGLGATMVMSSIIFLIRGYGDRWQHSIFRYAFGLSVLLLILSSSTSALVNFLLLTGSFFLLQILRWSYLMMIPTVFAIAIAGVGINTWIVNNATILFNLVGKDASLTGRKDLWLLVWDAIWKHPWLGYGYGGFWQGYNGESAYIWWASAFHPAHAHSGYLTILLDFGFFGLTVFWLGFGINFWKAIVWMRQSRDIEDIWPLIYLIYLLLSNQSESSLISSNSPDWISYVSISFLLDKQYVLLSKQNYLLDR